MIISQQLHSPRIQLFIEKANILTSYFTILASWWKKKIILAFFFPSKNEIIDIVANSIETLFDEDDEYDKIWRLKENNFDQNSMAIFGSRKVQRKEKKW